ncbi:MAG: hypothetical protein ACI9OJ_002510 [Myxococcota bacterium]|jgi:hypothetical protein
MSSLHHRSPVPVLAAVLFIGLLTSTSASAQWVTLDRFDGTVKANVSTSFIVGSEPTDSSDLVSHTDIFLQAGYADWGGYIQAPMIASGSRGRYEFGNIEIGALYNFALPMLSVTLHGGVALPTMPSLETCPKDGDPNSRGCLLSQFHNDAGWARLTDTPLLVANSITNRFGASIRIPMGVLHARADVGVDILFPLEESRDPVDDLELFFRANVGIGAKYLLFGGTFEWSIFQAIRDQSVARDDTEFAHSIAFSLRLHTKYVQPFIAGHLPLQKSVIGDIGVITMGLTSSFIIDSSRLVPLPRMVP